MPPQGHRKTCIWILIANQHVVRLFKKEGAAFQSFGDILPPASAGKRLTNKTIGRAALPAGASEHHKYEPHLQENRKEALAFAQEVRDWLDEAVRNRAFDRLVLVAAPRTLGDLRKVLSAQVQARIVAEVNKDLAGLPEKELQAELEKIVWF